MTAIFYLEKIHACYIEHRKRERQTKQLPSIGINVNLNYYGHLSSNAKDFVQEVIQKGYES